ncbi:hypothetical protein [Vibrio vulnificus]|uniref:hypothetical protein n=1 Tax=Vibrio vulnificus TaxID=672 RepID=UPI0039C8D1EB
MLSTAPVVLKPNSLKWRLPTTEQGECKRPNHKAERTAWNATTQYLKHGKKA